MKLFTKIAATVLAFGMLSGITAFADFTDMPTDNTRIAMENAVANGLLKGTSDTTIEPYSHITRGQMAEILTRAFNIQTKADLSAYQDMNPAQWYYTAVSKAVSMGAIQGDGQNINPENNITFQEAFLILSRIFNLTAPEADILANYPDGSQVADWAKEGVSAVLHGGYWTADTIRPTEYMTRADFAVVMDHLVSLYIDEGKEYKDLEVSGNILIRKADATLNNVKATGDIFIADSVASAVLTASKASRVVVRGGTIAIDGTYDQVLLIKPGTTANLGEVNPITLKETKLYGVKNSVLNMGMQQI